MEHTATYYKGEQVIARLSLRDGKQEGVSCLYSDGVLREEAEFAKGVCRFVKSFGEDGTLVSSGFSNECQLKIKGLRVTMARDPPMFRICKEGVEFEVIEGKPAIKGTVLEIGDCFDLAIKTEDCVCYYPMKLMEFYAGVGGATAIAVPQGTVKMDADTHQITHEFLNGMGNGEYTYAHKLSDTRIRCNLADGFQNGVYTIEQGGKLIFKIEYEMGNLVNAFTTEKKVVQLGEYDLPELDYDRIVVE